MKKFIFILSLVSYHPLFGQVEIPFFEQIAFNFYKDSLLTEFPVKKRVAIQKYTVDFHDYSNKFQIDRCLTGNDLTEGIELEIFSIYASEQMDFDSPTHVMNYVNVDKRQFIIKKSKTNRYPYLRISQPYHKTDNFENFYLIITENYKDKVVRYELLFNNKGTIKNWCRKELKSIIIH